MPRLPTLPPRPQSTTSPDTPPARRRRLLRASGARRHSPLPDETG
jgi:hypothetical protein